MASPNTFNDDTLLRKALYDLLANDTTLFNLISEASLNASEWLVSSWTPVYAAENQFTMPGDHSDAYAPGRRVRAHLDSGYVYSHVTEASFSAATGDTTITLHDSVLNSSLDEVALGIISPRPTNSLPIENPRIMAPIHLSTWQTPPDEYTVLSQDASDSDGKGNELLYKYVFPASLNTGMYTQIMMPISGYDLRLYFPYRMSASNGGDVCWRFLYRAVANGEAYAEIADLAAWEAADDGVVEEFITPSPTINVRNVISGSPFIIPASAYAANDTLQIALMRQGISSGDTHTGDAEVDDAIMLVPMLP